jgi:hypothetical protein
MNNSGEDIFGGLSPDEIKALLATVGDPAQLDALKGQSDMADKLRMGAFADHPGQMAGNVYAPDIAGSLVGGLGAIKGKRLEASADTERKGIFANQAKQSNIFINALRAKSGLPPLPDEDPNAVTGI